MIPPEAARRLFAIILVPLAAAAGCNTPLLQRTSSDGNRSGGAAADRMVAAYEDLASKRFLVIADFESPVQGALFRREPAGGSGVQISTQQARHETGVGSLRMSLANSSQQIVAEDRPESEWALARDWTPYHLLIFSVFSPRPLGGFSMSVRSGTDVPLAYTHPKTSLKQGWNLVRIDLGLMADRVNLADVRELRFWCDPLESPVELYLDDMLLVNNTRQIFGPAQPSPGDLYVRGQGRRLVVGASERFELVLSEGIIRQWYDLSSDPSMTRSLTGGLPLGACVVQMPKATDPAGWLDEVLGQTGPAPQTEVQQTIEESNALRVVILARWQAAGEASAADSPPIRQCTYSIYHDGRVYVESTGTLAGAATAFCCDGDAGFKLMLAERPAGAAVGDGYDPYALFGREQRGQADLLVVPFGDVTGKALSRPDDPRLCALWQLSPSDEHFSFAALLRFWPTDIDSAAQAGPMSADYRRPLPLLVDAGSLTRTDPGDFDRDGFSEGRGYYSLQLDGNVAKVRVSGRRHLRFSPTFKLTGVADRDVWVYVDGRAVETFRDGQGNLSFEVKGMISGEALVEVTSRAKDAK